MEKQKQIEKLRSEIFSLREQADKELAYGDSSKHWELLQRIASLEGEILTLSTKGGKQ